MGKAGAILAMEKDVSNTAARMAIGDASANAKEFVKAWQVFHGKSCLSVVYGQGTGSHVSIDFGRWLPRPKRLPNVHLREIEQTHEGELSLFILGAAWRLDVNGVPQCSSASDNANDGLARGTLLKLVGKSVRDVELDDGSWDCTIHFDSGLSLKLLCIEAASIDPEDNYWLFIPGFVFAVGENSALSMDKRSS